MGRIFCACFLQQHVTFRIHLSFTNGHLLEGMSDYLTSLTYPFSPSFPSLARGIGDGQKYCKHQLLKLPSENGNKSTPIQTF